MGPDQIGNPGPEPIGILTWVIDNIDAQINAFNGVSDTMRRTLAKLPPDERETVEAASRELRKARQAAAFIPLSALHRESPAQ